MKIDLIFLFQKKYKCGLISMLVMGKFENMKYSDFTVKMYEALYGPSPLSSLTNTTYIE